MFTRWKIETKTKSYNQMVFNKEMIKQNLESEFCVLVKSRYTKKRNNESYIFYWLYLNWEDWDHACMANLATLYSPVSKYPLNQTTFFNTQTCNLSECVNSYIIKFRAGRRWFNAFRHIQTWMLTAWYESIFVRSNMFISWRVS